MELYIIENGSRIVLEVITNPCPGCFVSLRTKSFDLIKSIFKSEDFISPLFAMLSSSGYLVQDTLKVPKSKQLES